MIPRKMVAGHSTMNVSCSAGMMNVAAVSEAMKCVMEHALTVDPTHPSWLRTKADIHFGKIQLCFSLMVMRKFPH